MIVEATEGHKTTLNGFLGLSKAFDCVNHTTLVHNLEYYWIRGVLLKLVKSYLDNRTKCVEILDVQSEREELGFRAPKCPHSACFSS